MPRRNELYLARTSDPVKTQQPSPPETPSSHDIPPQSIWRRIRGDALLFGGGNLGIMAAQLGFRAILIATLVPAEYGRLTLILTLYNTIWIIGASGVPSSVARYIALISPAPDSSIIRSATKARHTHGGRRNECRDYRGHHPQLAGGLLSRSCRLGQPCIFFAHGRHSSRSRQDGLGGVGDASRSSW